MPRLLVFAPCLLFALPGPATAQRLSPDEISSLVEGRVPGAITLYRHLLSFPNDAHYPDDIRRLVDALTEEFASRGFQTRELATPGSPLLLATREFPGATRTVLIYHQADGQPVDPTAWHQADPYQAVLKAPLAEGTFRDIPWERLATERDPEWRIFARSASDSKGQITQFLSALDALSDAGIAPDFNLKVIIDFEEELGSPNLPDAVERHRDLLAADMLVILDGPPHISNRPTLVFGARGIAQFTLTTYGPRAPQHSGHYGNYAPNPALRLAQILASMKDDRGRVTIPGFYDGISLDDETRAILAAVPDDEPDIMRKLGIAETDAVGGSLQEAVQYPSINIRGMASAWVGDQTRTIVPATATAEVDVRLVMESDPDRLLRLIRQHIEGLGYHLLDRAPTEAERLQYPRLATFVSSVSYQAFRTDFNSEPGRWLRGALRHLYGEEPILIRTGGGSIPISPFVKTLGIPAVVVPTVNPDNNQHSPNENLRLGNFVEGMRVLLAVLSEPIAAGT